MEEFKLGRVPAIKWEILNSKGAFSLPFFKENALMKIYSVSDRYIEYLRKEEPNVYSNKINARTHTRKYIGVVIQMNHYNYYIPMSSPKDSDYQVAGLIK